MASFFISHSSRDNSAAAVIREWLEEQGFTSVFLDFDPARGIPVGREWEAELYSQLRKADVVLFLTTGAAVDSKWCHAELVLSRSLGRTIVPLLLEAGVKHPLVRDTQSISVALDGPTALQPLADALRRLEIDPLDAAGWNPRLSPYPGLSAFGEDRAGVFFGRESEIETVLEPLRRPYGERSERLVLIVGASGSGKSSLLRAGVLPRLRRLEGGWIVLPTFMPEDAPLAGLARSVGRVLDVDWRTCHERLRAGGPVLEELTFELDAGEGGVLVSIDQAEQLVTQSSPEERLAFLELLATALGRRTQLRTVATLRSEYLSELVAGTPFEGNVAPSVPVGRLSRGALAEVIERPAQRAGLELEPGLVARMVEDTVEGTGASGDPLPLLAFALRQLYEQRSSPTRLSFDDYERIGGVVGALKEEAARTYERLDRQGLGDAVLPMLLELAHVEREREPTGRSVKRARLPAASPVVDAFVEARLLTSEGDEGTIQVAHEALFSEWPLLRDEIARSQQQLIARSQLERDAAEWERADRDPSYLFSGARLKSAVEALASGRAPDPAAADFAAALQRRSRRMAQRRRAFVGSGGLFGLAVVVVGVAFVTRAWFGGNSVPRAASAALVELPEGNIAVDAHEVTNGQYAFCVARDVCTDLPETGPHPKFAGTRPTDPVVLVDYAQASSFCAWIRRRLPSAAELELSAVTRRVKHLLIEGAWEWSLTKEGAGVVQVRPAERVRRPASPTDRDFDVGFRCAASS